VVVIAHGLAEHSGRYDHTASAFANAGLTVYAADHRGHGKSPGRRVHVASFEEFRADARAGLDLAHAEHPRLPLFLLGHSQGGLVAATLALRQPQGLAGLVLTSPLLGIAVRSRPSPVKAALGQILASFWPQALLASDVDPALLSRDPSVGAAYAADPLVSHAVSAGWYRALQEALADVDERAPSLQVPTLVLYAGADALVDPEATARWAARTPPGRVEAFRYDSLYHEILNAPEKEQVWRRIEEWILGRVDAVAGRR
jgi:alpha-beta hydrolase superfamily lysophospholipase